MVDLTFRTDSVGQWGLGKGSDLEASEVDQNFHNINVAITDLQENPAQPNNVESVSNSGVNLYFHLHDGTTIGPVPIPVLLWRWRDAWEALTVYAQLDIFFVNEVGLYAVMENHTSAATFDENATGTGPLYKKIFGFSGAAGVNLADLGDVALTSLANGQILQYDNASGKWKNVDPGVITGFSSLSDVLITAVANGDVPRWNSVDGKWENMPLGTMAVQDADAVDITGGTITGLPAPVAASDAATKAYVDSVGAGGLPSIADGTFLANIDGAPALPIATTLSEFFDYILGDTRGRIIFRGDTEWTFLDPGTLGQFLATGGAGADPSWDSPAGAGTVTSVASGTGLTGGPITGTGTLSLDPIDPDRFLANVGGASSAPTPTSLTAFIDHAISSTRGAILFRGATNWTFLGPGSSGFFLQSNGAGADLSWGNPVGSGTVTSVATGTGLTGGPVTSTGTISLDSIANLRLLANISGSSNAPVANTLTAILDAVLGTTRGSIIYRGATAYVTLGPGVSGRVLKTNGAGADPSWTPVGAGTVTSVDLTVPIGFSVSGNPITTSGTLAISATGVQASVADNAVPNLLNLYCSVIKYVGAATTGALSANTYANGSSGVGATLTGNSFGAITIDGLSTSSMAIGTPILVKDEATASHNGIYSLTQAGDGSHPYILTRVGTYDTNSGFTSVYDQKIKQGDVVVVVQGTTNSDTLWLLTNSGTGTGGSFIVGTDGLTFQRAAGVATGGSVSTDLDVIGATHGDMLYRGASAWSALAAAGTNNSVLVYDTASHLPKWITPTAATAIINAFVGDSGSGGTKGLVPAPAAGDAAAGKFLKADGTWTAPSGVTSIAGLTTDVTISSAADEETLVYESSSSKWKNKRRKGLFERAMSAVPTASNTGLDTWVNQGSSAVSDTLAGIFLDLAASSSGIVYRKQSAAVPATPYTITVLASASHAANCFSILGWTDGTKIHGAAHYGATALLRVDRWSNATTFSASEGSRGLQQCTRMWLQINDDGTNVKFRFSIDGTNFIQMFSVAKASGYLGSTGYSSILFGGRADNANELSYTLESWAQS